MNSYHVHFHFEVTSPESNETLIEHVDCVMGELLALENDTVTDSTVGVNADNGHVEVEMLVFAESESAAVEHGRLVARTAIHAAGGCTPSWDECRGTRDVEYDLLDISLEPARSAAQTA